jgi:hypothetical protein
LIGEGKRDYIHYFLLYYYLAGRANRCMAFTIGPTAFSAKNGVMATDAAIRRGRSAYDGKKIIGMKKYLLTHTHCTHRTFRLP